MREQIHYKFTAIPTIFEDILSLRTKNILSVLMNLQRMYEKENRLTCDGYFYLTFEELRKRTQTKTKSAIYPKLDTLVLHDLISIKSVGMSKGKKANYYRVKTENFGLYDLTKYDEIDSFRIEDIKSKQGYKVKYLHSNCKKQIPLELIERQRAIQDLKHQPIIKGDVIPITKDILQKTKVSVYKSNGHVPFNQYVYDCTLSTFLRDGEHYKEYVKIARDYKAKGNEQMYKQIKQGFEAATISATFKNNRSKDNVSRTNNIICLDIDGKEQTLPLSQIEEILKSKEYIFYLSKSLSNDGYFALVEYEPNITITDVFRTIYEELKGDNIILDKRCSDITRLRIMSYDDNPYFNPNAVKYTNTINKDYVAQAEEPKRITNRTHTNTIKTQKNAHSSVTDDNIQYMEKLSDFCKTNHITITRNHDETLFISRAIAATFGNDGKRWLVTIHKEQDYSNGNYSCDDTERITLMYERDLVKFPPSNQMDSIINHIENNCHILWFDNHFELCQYRKAI